MIISDDPVTHTYFRAFSGGAVATCFYDLGMLRLDSNNQPSACGANALIHCATPAVKMSYIVIIELETIS